MPYMFRSIQVVGKRDKGRWERRGTWWGFQSAATMADAWEDSQFVKRRVYTYTYMRARVKRRVTFQFCRDDGFLPGCAKKRVLIGTRRGQVAFKGSFCSFPSTLPDESPRDFFHPESLIRHSSILRNRMEWSRIIIDTYGAQLEGVVHHSWNWYIKL